MIYWTMYNYSKLKDYLLLDGIKVKKEKVDGEIKEVTYSNTIFTFDCETTSYFITPQNKIIMFNPNYNSDFYKECEKQAESYIWMYGINQDVIYGRTMKEYHDFEQVMARIYGTIKRIIYIHNLAFDFQFIRNTGFNFYVFARETHEPLYAECTEINSQYRCSYQLTGMSLDDYCVSYKLPYQKQVGDLDYNVLRTPKTELTEQELNYCEHDILCLYEIIKYHRTKYHDIQNIPLTKTGKLRKVITHIYFRNKKYHEMIADMMPRNYDEFNRLIQVYSGGYTHANYLNTNKIIENVVSYDITSSYPYECTTKKYPMRRFTETDKKYNEIDHDMLACIIDITFNDIEATSSNHFLPCGKAITINPDNGDPLYTEGVVEDNNKLVKAKAIRYILTDTDFEIVKRAYTFKKCKVNHIYVAYKDYLPIDIVKYILDLYGKKTQFKNVEGKETEYNDAKIDVNSVYGMLVTKTINDEIELTSEGWNKIKLTKEDFTEKLQKKIERKADNFNYAWGVWVAAYARAHLWNIILQLGDNLVYSDTDSVKFKVFEGYEKIFEADKKQVLEYEKAIQKCYELDDSLYAPLDVKGKPHRLGEFDYEGVYEQFITVGAKKYAFIKDGKLNITVSGIPKKSGAKALKDLNDFKLTIKDTGKKDRKGNEIYETIGKLFDYDEADKLEHYYCENQRPVDFEDGWHSDSKYGICLKKTTYQLGLHNNFADYLYKSGGCEDLF